jgi:uroporphyrinogen-III synthase
LSRVWVTRAQPGAEATAARLRALGHDPVVAPLLEVRPRPGAAPNLDGAGSVAFTSANGVAAFAALSPIRDLVADADVAALVRLIAADPARQRGAVLHVCPEEPAGDLVGALEAQGVEARREALYQTVVLDGASPVGIEVIMVHSPKAARALAVRAETDPRLRGLDVHALSEACAAPLRTAGFTRTHVAASPREGALLSLLAG